MAKTGRKQKPVELHVANGTHRRDRHGEKPESVPPTIPMARGGMSDKDIRAALPEIPETLHELGAEKWLESATEIIRLNYWQPRYEHALELYCLAWEELDRCERYINKMDQMARDRTPNGYDHEGRPILVSEDWRYPVNAVSGMPGQHPILRQKQTAMETIRKNLGELGLTPSSGAGMTVSGGGASRKGISRRNRSMG